jgi:hypothetical protein
MFRAACDNSLTTSPPASRPPANLRISKCPPANPICTKPVRANPLRCPTTSRLRLTATHHYTFHPQPHAAPSRVIPLRQLATLELADLNISARPAARPHTDSPSLTPTRRRSRPAPPTQHAHQPCLCAADNGDQYRVIVVRPGQPSAGLAKHRVNVYPP